MIYNHKPLAGTPTHVGEILRDEIQERGLSLVDIANASGIDYKILEAIVLELQGGNAQLAQGLEQALGIERDFWLNIQDQYDTDVVCKKSRNEIITLDAVEEISKGDTIICQNMDEYMELVG